MKIVIITAMPQESAAVLGAAQRREKTLIGGRHRYRCNISGHHLTVIETGMGMLNAGWSASAVANEQPDLIVSAGFGGAVTPGLSVGNAVMAEQILHWSGDHFEEVLAGFYGRNSLADRLGIPRGTFISCDQILRKKEMAAQLPEGCGLTVVEMEAAAVARVAAAQGIPFLAVRTISDPAEEELDFSIDEFCDKNMCIRPMKVLATVLKRPRIIPQLIRLAGYSRAAAKSLRESVKQLLEQI